MMDGPEPFGVGVEVGVGVTDAVGVDIGDGEEDTGLSTIESDLLVTANGVAPKSTN